MKGYVKNKNYILRKIEPYYFLIDITENYANHFLVSINETGAFIWDNFENVENIDALTELLYNAISSRDEVAFEELKGDIDFFITQMLDQNILMEEG